MNEFEWRRQLRDLRVPLPPPDNLWASIEARLDNAQSSALSPSKPVSKPFTDHRWVGIAGIAAFMLIAGGVAWHQYAIKQPTITVASAQPAHAWQPIDNHYAGAAIELESAQRELRQALQVAPGSTALQRLLQRTEQQQMQLQAREQRTG